MRTLDFLFSSQRKLKIAFFLLLLLAAFVIRIYKIDQIPAGLYIDEADYGLQARSLIETSRDYQGGRSPFWVHSFNDIRAPIPAYFVTLSTLIFETPELQVRFPSVVLGVLIVAIAFFLVRFWAKSYLAAILTAATFAFSPWQIQFSRFAHEDIFMMVFFLGALYCFFKAQEARSFRFLLAFSVLLSLTVYTYRPMSLFAPLIFFVLFVLYRREILYFGLRRVLIVISLAVFIILPFLYTTTIGAPDIPRISQLSITADPEVPIWVQRNREVDSGDFSDAQIGKKPSLTSFFFHSKPLSWLDSFANNYFQTFSTEFLFTSGDKSLRHSVGQMGHLLFIDILALVFGLFFLGGNLRQRNFQWLLLFFVLAPVPSSLTVDGAQHAARLFIFSAPLLLIVGLGWWRLYETVKDLKFRRLTLPIFIAGWLVIFVFYAHRYFVHYPLDSARSFGYGFKQAMHKIVEEEPNYHRIAMVPSNDPPMIYYLFWSKKDPRFIQEYGTNFSKEVEKKLPLDKYKVVEWPKDIGKEKDLARYLRTDTLYLVSQNELSYDLRDEKNIPEGVKLVQLVTYPDNEVAFYLITRDPTYTPPFGEPKYKIGFL